MTSSICSIHHTPFQGVWVFIIFVCKKNVFNVVKGKSNNLYNTLAKQMSSKSHLIIFLFLFQQWIYSASMIDVYFSSYPAFQVSEVPSEQDG